MKTEDTITYTKAVEILIEAVRKLQKNETNLIERIKILEENVAVLKCKEASQHWTSEG